ncbi:MAG TPA: response regulator [Candidatus Saccharimonadales bacterium]|nr:response regulator [Candidatus Saccharimonadales bacterium]
MSTKKHRILYVEDYPVIKIMYEEVLKSSGFDVDAVNDGQLALEKLADNEYDIILLDLLLPQITGLEFLREFIKKDNKATVVVLTDFDKPETVQDVKNLGVKHYWIKVENTPNVVAKRLHDLLGDKNND